MEKDNDLLAKRKKGSPHQFFIGVTSADVQMIWHGSLVELGFLSNYEVRQQEHHSWICAVLNFIDITTLVNLGNYGICSYLFCPLSCLFVAQSLCGTTSSNRSKQSISSEQSISSKQSTSGKESISSKQSTVSKESASSKQSISSKDAGKLYGWL